MRKGPEINHDSQVDSKPVRIRYECHGRSGSITQPKFSSTIWLDHLRITKIDLHQLNQFPNLRHLNLQYDHLTKLDLSIFEELSEIEWLRLGGNDILSLDLDPLSNCKKLEVLDLAYNDLENLNLTPLKECDSLKSLIISGNQLDESVGLSPIAECIHLKHLFASGVGSHDSFEYPQIFKKLEDLVSLDLSKNQLVNFDADTFGISSKLESLRISSNRITSIDLTPLRKCKLVSLDISDNPITEIDLSPLSSMGSLCVLSLLEVPLTLLDISSIYYILLKRKLRISDNPSTSRYIGHDYEGAEYNYFNCFDELDARPCSPNGSEFTLLVDSETEIEMVETFKPGIRISEYSSRGISWVSVRDVKSYIQEQGIQTFTELVEKLRYTPFDVVAYYFGFNELGFRTLDHELRTIIINMNKDVSPEIGLDKVHSAYFRIMEDKLRKGRSTDDLDVEKMQTTQAAKLIPLILQLRREEVESLDFELNETRDIPIFKLSKTFYGKMLIAELDINARKPISKYDFFRLQDMFQELGIKIKEPKGLTRNED